MSVHLTYPLSMSALADKYDIARKLQKEILVLQGLKKAGNNTIPTHLGEMENAFPHKTFPTGAVHEYISNSKEDAAATNGFIAALLGKFMQQGGAIAWVGIKRTIFPSALKMYGIDPGRIIYIDPKTQKEALWVVEEALKCDGLAGVVGEISELTFTESRRLQLAVEHSKVTGFIHRYNPRSENVTACVTRWKIQPLPSVPEEGMPGIGHPRWQVHLQKVRNGKPGTWQIEWVNNSFQFIPKQLFSIPHIHKLKTG